MTKDKYTLGWVLYIEECWINNTKKKIEILKKGKKQDFM